MAMTEQEARDFLAQFDKARESFKQWPKWLQDAARTAAATFPRGVQPSQVPSDDELLDFFCENHFQFDDAGVVEFARALLARYPNGVRGPDHG